jgi:PLD-like domain
MIRLLTNDIWTTINKLSQKSKRTKVAVAYFGTGAAKQLKLKIGDTLVVAMGLTTVKSGQVNPFEIEILLNKGVKLLNLPNLHSKIYLFADKVIVGSANVSTNSAETLIETAILTDDKQTIKDANKFIIENCVEKIEADYIEICKKNYNPPNFFGTYKKRETTKSQKFKGELSSLWVISTKLTSWKDTEDEIVEKERPKFEAKIKNKRTFQVDEIRYNYNDSFINSVKEGDIVIEIEGHKVKTLARPPRRVLGVTWDKKDNSAFLRTEERKVKKTKSWTELQRHLSKNGIKNIKKNSTREIINEDTKKILHDYFNK